MTGCAPTTGAGRTSSRNHEFFSQDFNFSEDLRAIGVKLWLEPNITIGHFGLVEHVGNVHLHLLAEHQKQKDAAAKQKEQSEAMANIEAFAKSVKEHA